MRCLTLRQPYAGAIFCPPVEGKPGPKNIENRPGLLSYRGLLAIHAGQRLGDPESFYEVTTRTGVAIPPFGSPRAGVEWSMGAIIGVVDLVSGHRSGECDDRCSVWAQPFKAHHRIANPRLLSRAVPALGQQTLWTPDSWTLNEIRRQLA